MLLLLSAFNDFGTPVERVLKGMCEVQRKENTTVSVVAACILHELLLAEKLSNAKKLNSELVPFRYLQDKYGLPRYQISRNAAMLSGGEMIDKANTLSGKREGKGWVKIHSMGGAHNEKALTLTAKGRRAAILIYGNASLPKTLPSRRKEK